MTFRKFKWSYDEEVLKMTKSSKELAVFGIALALAILIGGFLLHPWGRTKSELTVTKVDLSNNSIYATASNQLYGTQSMHKQPFRMHRHRKGLFVFVKFKRLF